MTLPSNLKLIKSEKKSHQGDLVQQNLINPEQWLSNPEGWNRASYVEQILELLGPRPSIATTSKVFMLASQVEVFVTCQLNIKQHGLTVRQNNGVTLGQNPHFKISDAALYRAVQLMKDLGLTAESQSPLQYRNPELADLLAGP